MESINEKLNDLRRQAKAYGAVSRVATDAGLAEATLRYMHTPGWNPRAKTIRTLEALFKRQDGHASKVQRR